MSKTILLEHQICGFINFNSDAVDLKNKYGVFTTSDRITNDWYTINVHSVQDQKCLGHIKVKDIYIYKPLPWFIKELEKMGVTPVKRLVPKPI